MLTSSKLLKMLFINLWKAARVLEEGSLPFVTFRDMHKVIGMTEVYGGVNTGFTYSRQEVRNEGEQVTVLFGNLVQPMEIDTEPKRAILFMEKKDRSTVRRL